MSMLELKVPDLSTATIVVVLVSVFSWASALTSVANEQTTSSPRSLAGYLDGDFSLQSADGRFKFIPSIAMQLRWSAESSDTDEDISGFFIRRGRVKFEGNVFSQDLTYEVEVDVGTPDPGDPQFDLKDLYIDYRFHEKAHVKVGQFKVPFGFQENTSSKKLQFAERSLASEEFAPGRDIGLMVWGPDEEERYEWYFGVFNGEGDNNFPQDDSYAYSGRFVFSPLDTYKEGGPDLKGTGPRLTLGGEFYRHDDSDGEEDIFTWGVFLGFKSNGFSFRAEYFDRSFEGSGPSELEGTGWYAQAGYFFLPKQFELAIRASEADLDLIGAQEERSAALSWFFHGHKAKVILDYTETESGDDETQAVRLQAQVYF